MWANQWSPAIGGIEVRRLTIVVRARENIMQPCAIHAATIPRTHSSVSETLPACRFKQRDAKFVFQLLNGRCHRRLRNIEFSLPLPAGRPTSVPRAAGAGDLANVIGLRATLVGRRF
jgi:hypothetical protein